MFKAHRRVCHSTPGSRVVHKKGEDDQSEKASYKGRRGLARSPNHGKGNAVGTMFLLSLGGFCPHCKALSKLRLQNLAKSDLSDSTLGE